MNKNLSEHQHDYARFLPALSGFYATYVGKQQNDPNYVDPARIPSNFENGVESLNYLNPVEGKFYYKWTLYSAGHAELDVDKISPKEDMLRKRDRETSWVLGDSGGFQIAKGVWEGDWKNPACPKAQKKRELVVRWMDEYMDYGMMLDIPTWTYLDPKASAATGINTYDDAVAATHINAEYYMRNKNRRFKVLNVLQGANHRDADSWYEEFKGYCDPAQYPDTHFDGWAMGGQNMCDVHLALRRIVAIHYDGLLQEGVHDVMHFLGTSKLEWACLLTDVQRAVRKYYNPNFTITFDCASPFLATANGQIYTNTETEDRSKWTYRMTPSVDDKKYALDQRLFRDAVLQDGVLPQFDNSPISEGLKISDVCIYAPGDLNKIGKEGKTSWDSFSYAIQMGHNVWSHINAVQQANREYDAGKLPNMLVDDRFTRILFKDVVEKIFSATSREASMQIIDDYSKLWISIRGTRGHTGKKTINATTYFNELFSVNAADDEPSADELHAAGEFTEDEAHKLDLLEEAAEKVQ